MKRDYHLHTDYSDDSKYPLKDLVKDAVQNGFAEICITDHVDYGVKTDWNPAEKNVVKKVKNVNYEEYYNEITQLQEKYKDQIVIRLGMEFGIQKHTIEEFNQLFYKYPFDFIILSCHQIENKEFWTFDFQKGKTQKEYNEKYYEEILYVVKKYHNYSVLGHLDVIKRYDPEGIYPFDKIKDILTEILTIVIKDGKGIEVNTSSHRYNLPDLTPSRDILKLYKELGGTILTIGSDAHRKEDVGAHIDDTKEELKKLGFEQYCTFEKMKPIFHSLDD